MSFVIW